MIYVTGDLHGELQRFKTKPVTKLREADFLLVCGDFGFVWDGSEAERKALRWIGSRRFTTLFVDGCHDNLDLLLQYPEEDFLGGRARRVCGNLLYLSRGTIVTLGDMRVFAMGGGESPDAESRVPGESWWPGELPSPAELGEAWARLEAAGCQVDYLVTHDCSSLLRGCVTRAPDHVNHLTSFFDKVQTGCRFKRWYFGCHHADKVIPPHYRAVFRDVVSVMER